MGRRPQLAHIQDSINGKQASHLKTAIWIWQLQPCRVLVFAVEFSQLPAAYSTLADVILSRDSTGQQCLNSISISLPALATYISILLSTEDSHVILCLFPLQSDQYNMSESVAPDTAIGLRAPQCIDKVIVLLR